MDFFRVLSKDLSQPEYIHVLMNPVPVYATGTAVLALLLGIMLRSRSAQVAALILVALSAASAWPVYIYGEKGYYRVRAMADNDGQKWLDAHRHRAENLIYFYYLTASVALAAILVPLRWPRTAAPITALTLILGIGLLCVGAYIAYAGGKVRHREFRNEPPPNASNGTAAHEWIARSVRRICS
jgi:glucan phosphoethanolaminetransferase (alkaline phosphatase superfamily)